MPSLHLPSRPATSCHTTPSVQAISDTKRRAALAGPAAFRLERMLTLFHCLLAANDPAGASKSRAVPYAHLLHQLTTLTRLGFLQRVSPAEDLTALRYRCMISLEAAYNVAITINFTGCRPGSGASSGSSSGTAGGAAGGAASEAAVGGAGTVSMASRRDDGRLDLRKYLFDEA